MAGKTNFGKINGHISDLEKKNYANSDKTRLSKDDFMPIKFGDNLLMVLPPFDDDADVFKKTVVHFGFLKHDGKAGVYKCSKEKYGECPICDMYYNDFSKEERQEKEGRASEIKPTPKYIYNVADHKLTRRIAELNASQHKEVLMELKTFNDENPDVDPTDPLNGRFIKLTRMKQDPWARARLQAKPIPVTEEVAQTLLDSVVDLSKLYIDNTPDELRQMLDGIPINVPRNAEVSTEESPVEETEEAAQAEKVEEEVDDIPDFVPPEETKPAPKVPTQVIAKPSTGNPIRPMAATPKAVPQSTKTQPTAKPTTSVPQTKASTAPISRTQVAGKAPAPQVKTPVASKPSVPAKVAPAQDFEINDDATDTELADIEAALKG